MNLAIRKLAMIEKEMIAKDEEAKIAGYTTSPVDRDFQEKVTKLMDRVRFI